MSSFFSLNVTKGGGGRAYPKNPQIFQEWTYKNTLIGALEKERKKRFKNSFEGKVNRSWKCFRVEGKNRTGEMNQQTGRKLITFLQISY